MKKKLLYLLGIILALTIIIIPQEASAADINVEYHSQSEIKQIYRDLNIDELQEVTYDKEPVIQAPYSAGKLSDVTTENALKTLNFVRYIAGVPYDVKINEEYQEKVQAGTLLNCVNGKSSHSPQSPDDMDETLYDLGYSGCSRSNLAYGFTNLFDAIINGWMYDGDDMNKEMIGHRRWCLNPTMTYTGFGQTGYYTAMYAVARSGTSNCIGVAWPAQNMPVEMLPRNAQKMPWSISMGKTVDASSVKVVLTDRKNNTKWEFSSSSADGYFNVNNDGYGQKGAIIFCPDDITGYSAGDIYDVSITGSDFSLEYTVNFFSFECEEHVWNSDYTVDKEATCIEEGSRSIHCKKCKAIKDSEVIPPTGHDTKSELVKATTTKDGTITARCQVCGNVVAKRRIPRASSMKLSYTLYTYNGSVKTPTVTVKDAKGKALTKNTDYTVSYTAGRKNVGTYKVTITFKGNYSGSKTLSFKINPKGTSISSLTRSTKAFTVKWKKQSTQTTGYQILYSTSSKFTNPKTVTITKNSTTYKKITKLTAKKRYYVRVRTYKTVGTTKYYSAWSSYKSVITRS